MIWLTWRQFRTQFAIVFGALVVVAIALALTGHDLVNQADTYAKLCKTDKDCGSNPLLNADSFVEDGLNDVVLLAPALIGIFWGAPLVARELETGTYRLGWSQSITRQRWLAVKLGLVGLTSVAVAGLFSLMVTWWSSPIDTAHTAQANRFGVAMFGLRDIVPLGYAAFAFALGYHWCADAPDIAGHGDHAHRLCDRPLGLYLLGATHLMSPVHTDMALEASNNIGFSFTPTGVQVLANPSDMPNAWIYSSDIVNKSGQAPPAAFLKTACPDLRSGAPIGVPRGGGLRVSGNSPGGPGAAYPDCVAKLAAKYHEVVTNQPASRFWAFQGIETAIFLVVALLLVGLCFWWVHRRLT